MKDRINKLAKEYIDEIINIRHNIHTNPELSFEEKETSKLVQLKLDEIGIKYKTGFAEHGILGIIKGEKGEGKTIALRADMDALPLTEDNDLPYKSLQKNKMHACGHDIHTACLLGAAKILNSLKSELSGTILLIFQPGEEKLPGGASILLDKGFRITGHRLSKLESPNVKNKDL